LGKKSAKFRQGKVRAEYGGPDLEKIRHNTIFMKTFIYIFLFASFFSFTAERAFGQRRAVSGAEVTGTFSTGGENPNEVKIAALGGGRLRVEFALTYAWQMDNGEWMANTGEPAGVASITGDRGVLELTEGERTCRITLRFVRPGRLEVSQSGECSGIVGGLNVAADGTYKKISAARPKFTEQ
jgi:hypothetical protein